MKPNQTKFSRWAITMTVVFGACLLGWMLWGRYMNSPWTRDGRVRADVVEVAPDVAGVVVQVAVRDNQHVRKGDLLFAIDPDHYRNALDAAQALVDERKAELDLKLGEAARRSMVDDSVVSREDRQDAQLAAAGAKARYLEARAMRNQARLNLERTQVRSPVDGWVSNLLVRPGDFAHVGAAELALVDQHSFWVYGYFEENKISLMKVGDPAEIRLLGSARAVDGHVESIARGISDRDNPTGSHLLANVNPSFNWVRLAQRVPVRIKLDAIHGNQPLVAGMTCTVVIHPRPNPAKGSTGRHG